MLKALLTIIISSSLLNQQTPGSLIFSPIFSDIISENSLDVSLFNLNLPPLIKPQAENKPIINALSSLAMDLKTGNLLHAREIEQKLPIASITKLMTVIIILEENNFEEEVTIGKETTEIGGVKIWLFEREKITIKNLLKASLIHSANDAAHALAIYNAGNVADFVKKMNQKSELLGLKNTHFSNPMGFDDDKNYSTAFDLAILTTYGLKKTFIRETIQIQKDEIFDISGKVKHSLESTNKLLTDDFLKVKGVKTGQTEKAGGCFIALIENEKGNEFLTVILNSPARFSETKALAAWVIKNYIWL